MEQRVVCTEVQKEMAASVGICFPTILPLFKSPPNKAAIEAWISRHQKLHPKLGSLARIYADNINYIAFEEFLSQLKTVISSFHEKTQGKPYVLWIPRQHVPDQSCSDVWMAGLALELAGLRWPENIVLTPDLSNYLLAHPEVTTVLALDDCLYTGKHMSEQLAWFWLQLNKSSEWKKYSSSVNLYFGIPFQTKQGKSLFDAFGPKLHDVKITVLPYRRIHKLEEIIDEEMQVFAEKMRRAFNPARTLTYFDHVMPDFMSTDPVIHGPSEYLVDKFPLFWLINGCTKIGCASHPFYEHLREVRCDVTEVSDAEWQVLEEKPAETGERLVPDIIRPYRLQGESSQTELNDAVRAGTVGQYSGVVIPERYPGISDMLQEYFYKQRKHAAKYGNCCGLGFFGKFARGVGVVSEENKVEAGKIKKM